MHDIDCPLPPIVHPDIADLIQGNVAELYKLIDLFGSPLHVVFPHVMQQRIECFRDVLDSAGMRDGRIYFAAKANKANTFLAVSAVANIGADVSSVQELNAALGRGIRGEQLSVSGPTKLPELLFLAVLHDSLIGIDQPSELETILRMTVQLRVRHQVRVSLRIADREETRFGMPGENLHAVISRIADVRPRIRLEGFSFHVPGYESRDRVSMIRRACDAITTASGFDLSPCRINIGGGLQTAYANARNWDRDKATEREFVEGFQPSFVYPYSATPAGHEQLGQIIRASRSAIREASDSIGRPIIIDAEPGRSLLDQAGISLFRVRDVRPIGKRWVVVVDGNSMHLSESWFNSEFFVDPMLITSSAPEPEQFKAAIAANTCMESDYLARRLIPFPARPSTGDLLVYVNTAGYQMDSMESEFHRLPLPRKVAAFRCADAWRFVDDDRIGVADVIGIR